MIIFILLLALLFCIIGMIDSIIEISDEYHKQLREYRREVEK